MKTALSKSKLTGGELDVAWTNLEAMRNVVRIFKQGDWNNEIPSG